MKYELLNRKYETSEESQVVKMVALLCQAEHGDATTNSYQQNLYLSHMNDLWEPSEKLLNQIYDEHCELAGMSPASAEYHLLQAISELPMYGTEFHDAKRATGETVKIGVGPEGLSVLHLESNKLER